jgi:hypothetical protein
MECSLNSFSHELAREEYELEPCPFESDWDHAELSRSFYNDKEADEGPEGHDVFYSDDEQVQEADEELSVVEEYGQDCVEYVHFGKGLEYDGKGWIWEEDVDFWSEMSR